MRHEAVTWWPFIARTDADVDVALDQSFPASDPPPWTVDGAEGPATGRSATLDAEPRRAGALSAALRPFSALLGAAGLSLLVPLFIVALPLALLYRLALELTRWPAWLHLSAAERRARRAATYDVLPGF